MSSQPFQIGEWVRVSKVVSTGRRIQVSTLDAKVVSVDPAAAGGFVLTLQFKNGRRGRYHESEVRRENEHTHAHDILEALANPSTLNPQPAEASAKADQPSTT